MDYVRGRGFTVIELSIALIILGLFIAGAASMYTIYTYRIAYEQTIESVDQARNFITIFYESTGRYPCPADPTLPQSHPQYGQEQCRTQITNPCPANIACTTDGSRNADGRTGAGYGAGGSDPVMIGAVPVKTINQGLANVDIQARFAFDGWNMKLTYAVSEIMTQSSYGPLSPAPPQLGAIDLVDEFGNSVIEPASSIHYVLVSHGQNNAGAYTRDGSVLMPGCSTPPRLESENCNRSNARFVSALQYHNSGPQYYDDIVVYGRSFARSLWRRAAAAPGGQLWLHNTNLENVGIGEADPVHKLHVAGNIKAEISMISDDDRFCHETTMSACMEVEFIAGSGDMCPDGHVATGIQNNSLRCQPLLPSGAFNIDCPPGQGLRSFRINNVGGVEFDPAIDCATTGP